jgi:hypothetical protein
MRVKTCAAVAVVVAALGARPVRAEGPGGWSGTWLVVGSTGPVTRELEPGPGRALRLEWLQDGEPLWAEGAGEPGARRLVLHGSTAVAARGLVAAVASGSAASRRVEVEVELVRLGAGEGATAEGPWAHDGDGVERLAVTVRKDGREVARQRWVRPGRPALELAAVRVGVRERPLAAGAWRPGRDGPLTLVVRVLGAPQRVALVVRDAAGAPVRALGGEAVLAPGVHRLGWDGRVGPEPGARVVPPGEYRLALDSPELYVAHGEDAAPVTTSVRVARR